MSRKKQMKNLLKHTMISVVKFLDTIMAGDLLGMNELKQQKQKLLELTDDFGNLNFDIDIGVELNIVKEGDVKLLWPEQTVTQADEESAVAHEKSGKNCHANASANGGGGKQSDDNSDDDESRAEATITFTVKNISKLKDKVFSHQVYIRNLPWKILAMPRIVQTDQKTLGFYLQCNTDSQSSWSCSACADMRILNARPGTKPFTKKIQHKFFRKENDWGFNNFISWNDLLDPEKGYVKDDKVTLEVHCIADASN